MKKYMKKYSQNMMSFAGGSMVAGASGMMTAPFGMSGGVSAASSMLPTMGTMVGVAPVIGMASGMAGDFEPKQRRRRRRK